MTSLEESSRRLSTSSSSSSSSLNTRASPSSSRTSSSSSSPIAAITPSVEMKNGINGIRHFVLQNGRGASATISIQGAQVVSWKTERDEELLFMSSKAVFDYPHPVRGGIPICFPQFVNQGTLEKHGFAMKKIWFYEKDPPPLVGNFNGKAFIDFVLRPTPEDDLKIWPHGFEFRIRVTLAPDGSLALISRIRNVDISKFSFSIAYHTYFFVSDIGEVRVEGLETLNYVDNLLQSQRFTEQGGALTFESEVNRVYIDTDNMVAILDHQKKRTFVIRKDGFPDIVVWNPGERKSKAIVDFGDDDYKHMLCVDGASVENPITLKPGEEWTGRLEFSLVLSS